MASWKPEGYANQMGIFINNKDYAKAYDLGLEFVKNHPKEGSGHYLLALSAFNLGKLQEAMSEGNMAFTYAKTKEEMASSAVLVGTICLKMKDFRKGYDILAKIEKLKSTQEMEELLVCFALALKDDESALKHIDRLLALNKDAGEKMILKILEAKSS